MEGLYHFGEYLRWSYGFSSPNAAGAFIAMLMAFIMPFTSVLLGRGKKRLLWGMLFVGELLLWFLLAKTYSRGALFAAIVCLVISAVAVSFKSGKYKEAVAIFIVKAVLISAVIFVTGFYNRISPDYMAKDGSVCARADLWCGGLEMISVAPLTGWGNKSSGREYINWFQDITDGREYAGMVNSYLCIASELGLPVLSVILLPFLFLILLGFVGISQCDLPFSLGASLGILAYLIANFASTLMIFGSLLSLVLFFAIIILLLNLPLNQKLLRKWKNLLLISVVLTLVFCVGLFLFAKFLSAGVIEKNAHSVTLFSGQPLESLQEKIAFLADSSVLGIYYGKEIRSAVNGSNFTLTVFPPDTQIMDLKGFFAVVSCGESVKYLNGVDGARLIIVNPVGIPPKEPMSNETIIFLPELDNFNQNGRWLAFAKRNGFPYYFFKEGQQRISQENLSEVFNKIYQKYIRK